MNKFEKYFTEYYSNASFVRWYTEDLAMIRHQYQREVVESFLFVDNKLSFQEKKFYDFQITYHFEYFPNKQGKIVRQYHEFELQFSNSKLGDFEGSVFNFDKPVYRLDVFRKKAFKLVYALTNNPTIKKFI